MREVLSFFFFGTLMDSDLRDLVVGRPVLEECVRKAFLPNTRRVAIRGQSYPIVVPDAGNRVEGHLVRDLDETAAARLGYYEGDEFDAELRDIELPTGNYTKAWVFLSNPDLSLTSGKWRLGDWQRQFKRESLCQARSAMAEIDTLELDGLKADWRNASA